jgi:hypothetical protein
VPVLQENEDYENDQQDRDQQRNQNFLDRGADEVRSVEGDLIRVAGRHRLRNLRHRGAHVLRDLQRVGRRFAEDREDDGRAAVVARRRDVVLRTELDLGDVTQP